MDATTLAAQSLAIDQAWTQLPPPARPAADFQKLLLRLRAGADPAACRAELEKYARVTESGGTGAGLRDLAKCWLARLAMREIDHALRQYYRHAVRFPEKLDEVKSSLPEWVKLDPWGEAWAYQPTAPAGFDTLQNQRYQLGPSIMPHLSPWDEAAAGNAAPGVWKAVAREAAVNKAVELRSPEGKTGIVQPGGRVGDGVVVFIGDGWVLLADSERLFVIPLG